MMGNAFSVGLIAALFLSAAVSQRAHGEDAEFCAPFKQYYAERDSDFLAERGARRSANQDLWVSNLPFPNMHQCSLGEQSIGPTVQCKYDDPGVMGAETLARHQAMAKTIDECISTIPGLGKIRRAHDTNTGGSVFYLSEGWEVDDSGGTYGVSLIGSGLVLMYVRNR